MQLYASQTLQKSVFHQTIIPFYSHCAYTHTQVHNNTQFISIPGPAVGLIYMAANQSPATKLEDKCSVLCIYGCVCSLVTWADFIQFDLCKKKNNIYTQTHNQRRGFCWFLETRVGWRLLCWSRIPIVPNQNRHCVCVGYLLVISSVWKKNTWIAYVKCHCVFNVP